MTSLGFTNPSAQLIWIDINMLYEDRITRIASVKDGLPTYTKLEGLEFSPAGIVEEFPDLKGKPLGEMKVIALNRFKKYIREKKTEKDLIEYLKDDLKKHGYELRQIRKPGHRPINITKWEKS